jgi:Domain of unknown function (DUF4156)
MIRPFALSLAASVLLSGCTWVKMEPQCAVVRVAQRGDDLSGCTRRGEVGVSVRDRVGLYQRNDLKVRDELETMARNEASSLAADTVQAVNEPSGGEQRFEAYACGRHTPTARVPAAREAEPLDGPRQADEAAAETYPVRDE